MIGNHDAHGKNFSLLYEQTTARAVLAPAYDLLSTVAYSGRNDLSRKIAMRIGDEYRPAYVRARHLDRMLDGAGLGVASAKRRLRALASSAVGAARSVRTGFAEDGWNDPILVAVQAVILNRSERLLSLAAPQQRRGGAPGAR